MNEEELFCKLFPEYVVNGKPLSPYFDLFESGYEQAEKRIEELEKKISVLLSCKNCPENKGGLLCQKEYEDKCLAQKIQYIKELKEENKVLAQNLEDTEIINKTYEKRFKDLEKENAELKSIKDVADLIRLNNSSVVAMAQLNNNNVALRKENAELTKDMANAIPLLEKATVISDLLTKATNVIKKFYDFVNNDVEYEPENPEVHTKMWNELCADAEQFLKECK